MLSSRLILTHDIGRPYLPYLTGETAKCWQPGILCQSLNTIFSTALHASMIMNTRGQSHRPPHFATQPKWLDLLGPLLLFLPQFLDDVPFGNKRRIWFQLGGCQAHYARGPLSCLDEIFYFLLDLLGSPVA